MPSILEDAGKYTIAVLIGAVALIVVNWINSPTMEDFRKLMHDESPWSQERLRLLDRLDAMERDTAQLKQEMERSDTALALRIDSILSKLDGLQVKFDSDSRATHNSLYRIMAKLELLEETKKKEGEDTPQ